MLRRAGRVPGGTPGCHVLVSFGGHEPLGHRRRRGVHLVRPDMRRHRVQRRARSPHERRYLHAASRGGRVRRSYGRMRVLLQGQEGCLMTVPGKRMRRA